MSKLGSNSPSRSTSLGLIFFLALDNGYKLPFLDSRFVVFGERVHIDQSGNVNSKLTQDRQNDVRVEDIGLRSLLGELIKGLQHKVSFYTTNGRIDCVRMRTYPAPRNTEEAHGHEDSRNSMLQISKFDTIEVQNGQTVRRNQAIEGQNLVHLDSSNKSTASLADDVVD